ncbi:hypothetical protein GJ496_008564 [Pomphorhynchus laevis]|nr:hypothetical protein GJ496_008564 [Pomphorhynchus laevis]
MIQEKDAEHCVKNDKIKDARLVKIWQSLKIFQDFPKPGIKFIDIFPLFQNPYNFQTLIDFCKEHIINDLKSNIDCIVGVELRGCLFGVPLALQLNMPFVAVRKMGKLPGEVVSQSYGTEYSKECMEMQTSSLIKGWKVLIVDDLLATGGTISAATELVRKLGCTPVECLVIIELLSINGRQNVGTDVYSVFEF